MNALQSYRSESRSISMQTGTLSTWNPGELILTQRVPLPKNQLYGEDGRRRSLFFATAPFSEYGFACVSEKGGAFDWMQCCVKAFRYFGKAPRAITCAYMDGSDFGGGKSRSGSGISTLSLNAFAAHYGTVLFCPRKRVKQALSDRDEPLLNIRGSAFSNFVAKRLAQEPYVNSDDLGQLVGELAEAFNSSMGVRGMSRKEDFEINEAPGMLDLPDEDYDMSVWFDRVVQCDYHFSYDKALYSVPYQYAHSTVRVHVVSGRLEVYSGGELIAKHSISNGLGMKRVVTDPLHRPPSHRKIARRLQDYFEESARKVGPAASSIMKELLLACEQEDGCYRRCKELLDLQGVPSILTLEKACQIVLDEGLAKNVASVSKVMNG